MILRNKMVNLKSLDLADASILYSSYEYCTGYHSRKDTLTTSGIDGIPLLTLILPKTLKNIQANSIPYSTITTLGINSDVYSNDAFKANAKITEVIISGNATKVPYNLFMNSTALQRATIHHVAAVESSAFRNCSALKTVVIDSVPTIGDYAFYVCKSLSSLTITEGTTSLGADAFNSCSVLTHVSLPNSLQTIGNRAFANSALSAIEIPSGVTTIGMYAFSAVPSSSGSKTVAPYTSYKGSTDRFYYNETYVNVTSGTYVYSSNVLQSLTFAPGSRLRTINRGAFMGCHGITKLTLPDSLEVIDQSAFAHCGIDTLRMPARLRSIAMNSFWNCTNLKHIEFSKNIKTIPSMCFADCSALDTLKLAVGLRTIDPYAFYNCTGLKTIKISSSVENIGNYAFNNCSNVEKVYTYTLEPTSINQNTFSSWRTSNLYVPTTSFYTYFYETQWSQFLNLVEFDEPYEYFYLNNDYVLDDESGVVKGKPDADLYPGSALIASSSTTQSLGILATNETSAGLGASIVACQSALSADSLIIRIGTKKGKWSFFCFPMDVQFAQIDFPYRYIFREYNGQKRANNGVVNGFLDWENVSSTDYLHHGKGYIFQGEETDSLIIRIANPHFDCTDFSKAIQVYPSAHNYDQSWNYIGNPYPCYYDMDGLRDAGFVTPVYVWNGTDYDVYLPGDDEYHFHPFEGFFIQNPKSTNTTLVWQEDSRETKQQADEKNNQAPARQMENNRNGRYLINLVLSNDAYADRTRVVFNNQATNGYELGRDAIKMTGDAPLHIYTFDSEVHYSINERPFSQSYISLGYQVDSAGYYMLSAQRMDTTIRIHDNVTDTDVNLSEGSYSFYTEAGVNETRFSLLAAEEAATPTQLEQYEAELGKEVNVFSITGVCLYRDVLLSDITLPTGVYLLQGKSKTETVVIP